MKTLWSKYVRAPFMRALTEVPWFGPVVSAVLMAMLINILTEALITWGGLWLGWGAFAALALATVAFVYIYTVNEARRRGPGARPHHPLAKPAEAARPHFPL